MHHELPSQVSQTLRKTSLSIIKLTCDLWCPAQVAYKGEVQGASQVSRGFQGKKIKVLWKWKKGLLFFSCSLAYLLTAYLQSSANLPSARAEHIFSYYFYYLSNSLTYLFAFVFVFVFLHVILSFLDLAGFFAC